MFGMDRAWEQERARGMELMVRSMERQGITDPAGIHYIPAASAQNNNKVCSST